MCVSSLQIVVNQVSSGDLMLGSSHSSPLVFPPPDIVYIPHQLSLAEHVIRWYVLMVCFYGAFMCAVCAVIAGWDVLIINQFVIEGEFAEWKGSRTGLWPVALPDSLTVVSHPARLGRRHRLYYCEA